MSYDFCLGCGVLLSPHVYDCPICGFDNSFGEYHEDLIVDDTFLNGLNDDFTPEEESY